MILDEIGKCWGNRKRKWAMWYVSFYSFISLYTCFLKIIRQISTGGIIVQQKVQKILTTLENYLIKGKLSFKFLAHKLLYLI
jgi:hypothetical protein